MNPIKFSLVSLVSFMLIVSSCKKKEIAPQPQQSNSLSSLTASPAFAKQILSAGENRIFSISLKDGKQLNFNVTSAAQTMFGIKRTLIGDVTINNKKDKALLLIGDNGFAVNYYENGHYFILQSKVELELGFKQPEVDLNSADFKNQFATYAKQNGKTKAANVLANYKKLLVKPATTNTDNKYDVIIEQNDGYKLIDRTLTEQKIAAADGKTRSENITMPADANIRVANSTTNNKTPIKFYTLEVAYVTPGFNGNLQYSVLCLCLSHLDPTSTKLFPIPLLNYITSNKSKMEIVEILSYMAPNSNHVTQLDMLRKLNLKYPVSKGVCRIGLYAGRPWGAITGVAYQNCYSDAFSSQYSCLVINDRYNQTLAHECGHNLGAVHVSNSNDIMSQWAGEKGFFHLNETNINAVMANF